MCTLHLTCLRLSIEIAFPQLPICLSISADPQRISLPEQLYCTRAMNLIRTHDSIVAADV